MWNLDLAREPAAVVVVDADGRAFAEVTSEQTCLRCVVGLHAGVVVEVVTREVGEDSDVETGSVDPVFGQSVARHLHRDRVHSLLDELDEALLQLTRFRRGPRRGPGRAGPRTVTPVTTPVRRPAATRAASSR